MIMLPLMLAQLLATPIPVADTVWWRTQGGTVTETRDPDTARCTLSLESGGDRTDFVWERGLPAHGFVSSGAWRNQPDQVTSIGIRIGDTWLDHGSGAPNITAMTAPTAYMVILNQPVDTMLKDAQDVAVVTPGGSMRIGLSQRRVKALLAALDRCRAAIGR